MSVLTIDNLLVQQRDHEFGNLLYFMIFNNWTIIQYNTTSIISIISMIYLLITKCVAMLNY